jgi:hypothetical protein
MFRKIRGFEQIEIDKRFELMRKSHGMSIVSD